ncbi:MAG: hypothetical protein ABIH21_01050 [Patescibacteria group bacterium]
MTELLNPMYWINLKILDSTQGIGLFFTILFALFIIAGIVCKSVAKQKRSQRYLRIKLRHLGALFTTMGILGLLLSFFGYERVRFFGARLWYPIWVIVSLVWVAYIVKVIKKDIPLLRKKEKERIEREKYMPGPRKK